MLGEIADVLFHLLRAGRTIEAEDVDREWLKNRHHSCDVGPHQHRSGGFHRHRHHQRPAFAPFLKRIHHPLQGCLDLQHVLAGFDDEEIHPAHE